jgi:hypothetical protein|nr:hypothetical protein [uncultured Peptostreptococcus sp.]
MKNDKDKDNKIAMGVSLGLIFRAAIGAARGNIGLWIAIGMCIGAGVGAAVGSSNKNNENKK